MRWNRTDQNRSASITRNSCGRSDRVGRRGNGSTGDPDAISISARTVDCIFWLVANYYLQTNETNNAYDRSATTHTSATFPARSSTFASCLAVGCIAVLFFVHPVKRSAKTSSNSAMKPVAFAKKHHQLVITKMNYNAVLRLRYWPPQDGCSSQ